MIKLLVYQYVPIANSSIFEVSDDDILYISCVRNNLGRNKVAEKILEQMV
jgi:hypothetical protein